MKQINIIIIKKKWRTKIIFKIIKMNNKTWLIKKDKNIQHK
jgi:hypothetical protein